MRVMLAGAFDEVSLTFPGAEVQHLQILTKANRKATSVAVH